MAQAILDYLPLTIKFLQHWSDVERELGKSLILEDGTTQSMLEELKAILTSAQSTITSTENNRQGAIQGRDSARDEALAIARQARKGVLSTIPSSEEARQLPKLIPAKTHDVQTQLRALRDVENVWQKLDALPANHYPSLETPYIVLVDLKGSEEMVGLGRFRAAVARLDTSATALSTAEQVFTQAQQNRKKVIEKLAAIFKAYRLRIRGLFPRTNALYRSLP